MDKLVTQNAQLAERYLEKVFNRYDAENDGPDARVTYTDNTIGLAVSNLVYAVTHLQAQIDRLEEAEPTLGDFVETADDRLKAENAALKARIAKALEILKSSVTGRPISYLNVKEIEFVLEGKE